MNQVSYNEKCQCCHQLIDEEDCVVDINKAGQYLYFCSYDCQEKYMNKGNKHDRADRLRKRREKYEGFGEE